MSAPLAVPAPRGRDARDWHLGLSLVASCLFVYLLVFIRLDAPRAASGDQAIYLHHATRYLEGELIYRDFAHFTPPGTDLIYAGLFKLLGVRAWIPQVALILIGASLAWLSTVISKRLVKGAAVYLPGFLFLSLPFSSFLDATHHWYSLIAITAALAVVIEKRTASRLAVAGIFCGIAACFTQSAALVTVGFGLFLWWEKRRENGPWSSLLKIEACLLTPALATILSFIGYYVWKVGLRHFVYYTLIFPAKYYPADKFNNWRVYLAERPSFHVWANWPDLVAWVMVHILVPGVYLLFFVRYGRLGRLQPDKPWDRLMLVNLTGLFLFLSVAAAPSDVRLYCVSLPALIVLVWFLSLPHRLEQAILRTAWAMVLILGIAKPIVAQIRWRAYLQLPTGRTAFLDPVLYDKCQWLVERTRPSQYLFGDPFLCFALRLRNPSRIPFVRPTDYTRPEDVQQLVQTLEEHQVEFVSWYNGLDVTDKPAGDHLAPLRSYLSSHYHVARTFSNLDTFLERNPGPPCITEAPSPKGADGKERL